MKSNALCRRAEEAKIVWETILFSFKVCYFPFIFISEFDQRGRLEKEVLHHGDGFILSFENVLHSYNWLVK